MADSDNCPQSTNQPITHRRHAEEDTGKALRFLETARLIKQKCNTQISIQQMTSHYLINFIVA